MEGTVICSLVSDRTLKRLNRLKSWTRSKTRRLVPELWLKFRILSSYSQPPFLKDLRSPWLHIRVTTHTTRRHKWNRTSLVWRPTARRKNTKHLKRLTRPKMLNFTTSCLQGAAQLCILWFNTRNLFQWRTSSGQDNSQVVNNGSRMVAWVGKQLTRFLITTTWHHNRCRTGREQHLHRINRS